MAEEETILQITRNLKNAVSAILQGYGDGQGPVTDTSAELHRLCGCLELLLQFDQKEQRSFLGAQKDYWDFLFTALRRQRGCTEQISFVCSQSKLKTSLGKGRAFIRLCLACGQLAESMQLCLLSPDLTREWYGPRSPLLCPELQEEILDSLYALNGIAFNLDLQRPDLDEDWPMFSESRHSNPSRTQERRPRKPEGFPKEASCSRGQLQGPDARGTSCLQDAPKEDHQHDLPTPLQHGHLPTSLEKKRGDSRSLSCPQSIRETEGDEFQLDQKEGGPKNRKSPKNSAACSQRQREGAKEAQKEDPRYELQLAKEQAQRQEQLLQAQERELQTLQEQLSRCEAERARLQMMLGQKQQEAERRDAMYEKELEGQRDLVQAMKRRVLELIHEKDHQWQRLQQLSTVAAGHCMDCNKVFRRLSRRYPCSVCVCHARACMHLHAHVCHSTCVENREQLAEIGPLLPCSVEAWCATPALQTTRRGSTAAQPVPSGKKSKSTDRSQEEPKTATPFIPQLPPSLKYGHTFLLEAGEPRHQHSCEGWERT
ncbi:RUN and FYVE domain-containing protein 4 isoform X3 [Microtus oregoni]|uniref:RUN and FYVE domain-containing protein 4 isoform X3 n=1 Tax=Microtus oregoni TaxID=111838 RepID=UPI001BB26DC6|nr:RUN and FYVE domain-containing protein 4 isoform X3 [Microtus oregoni]